MYVPWIKHPPSHGQCRRSQDSTILLLALFPRAAGQPMRWRTPVDCLGTLAHFLRE